MISRLIEMFYERAGCDVARTYCYRISKLLLQDFNRIVRRHQSLELLVGVHGGSPKLTTCHHRVNPTRPTPSLLSSSP